jgi:hypothetical protein
MLPRSPQPLISLQLTPRVIGISGGGLKFIALSNVITTPKSNKLSLYEMETVCAADAHITKDSLAASF